MSVLLSAAHRFFETPIGYNAIQLVNRPTVNMVRSMISKHLVFGAEEHMLDVGCGTGNYRNFFGEHYCGVDINPDYIALCKGKLPGTFLVGDGTDLKFPDASFDQLVSIATTHHLDDDQLAQMINDALRVVRLSGYFHIIDAVLPRTSVSLLKTIWFNMDRGQYPRKCAHLESIIASNAKTLDTDIEYGLLHDIAYFRIGRRKTS